MAYCKKYKTGQIKSRNKKNLDDIAMELTFKTKLKKLL